MRKSARLLHRIIPGSVLEVMPGYYHGELSLNHADEYVRIMLRLMAK